jgi:hypothetical protein
MIAPALMVREMVAETDPKMFLAITLTENVPA